MMTNQSSSVVTIDCHYLKPKFAAAFLLIHKGRATFIENNTTHAVPHILNALEKYEIQPEKVDYLIVTHAHLDHAGGTSALLDQFKNAKVVAHPKAAKTLCSPERLIQSAKKVYGSGPFEKLYGEIKPLPETRVLRVNDGESLTWGERKFSFIYTLGHASHHICVHDSATEGVFTGDAFGLYYPEIQGKDLFILPSTSPIDYDPIEAKKSVEAILNLHPKTLFLTHFGEVSRVQEAKNELLKNLDIHEALYHWAKANLQLGDELSKVVENRLKNTYSNRAQFLKLDLELNAQGIAFAARKPVSQGL